uniref:Uncharacterized protein n=1 Tax=Arundo donax TaxID=35708 RepID=A0A0A9CUV6_ARUDO
MYDLQSCRSVLQLRRDDWDCWNLRKDGRRLDSCRCNLLPRLPLAREKLRGTN